MNTTASPAPPADQNLPAGGTLRVLLTLALGFVMATIDLTAVNVALPDISANLKVALTGLVWVVDGYTLTYAAFLMVGGAMADRYGARKAYQTGLSIFLAASVLCAIAPSGDLLIAARLLQGFGAALFMPSSLSLLTFAFPEPKQRVRMLGLWSAIVGASSAIGPLIGGVLVHQFGWRSVFWINVPLGVLGIVLAQVVLAPTYGRPRALSLANHALAIVALSAMTFALIEGPAQGWLSVSVVGCAAACVVAAVALVWLERLGSRPILPHTLVQTPGFGAANAVGFLINFGAFGQLFLLTLFLQQARGADALHAGLQLLPMMAAIAAGNLVSGRVSAQVGTRKPMLFGLGAAALGGALMTWLPPDAPYLWLVVGVCVMNFSAAVAIPAMTTTVMQIAGKTYASSAAASLNANRQLGALVGVALIGTILHSAPAWNVSLPISFIAVTLAYAMAALLVLRRIPAASH